MKRTLKVVIENVRDRACSDGKGKFCPWMRTKHFGQRFYCGLFADDTGEMIELRDQKGAVSGEGTLQRLPQCLKAEEVKSETKDDSKARCVERKGS